MKDKTYFSREEALKYLGISRTLLDRMIREGLPYIMVGRRRLFRKEDIDAYMESKVATSEPSKRKKK